MSRFRFNTSTDILSPLHSDISFNDVSAFSFGSLSGTSDYDKDIESPVNKPTEKDSDINPVCKRTINESANPLEMTANDFKFESNINADKEERFKESYEMLRQSMDSLFYNKNSNSSILSPISKDVEFENFYQSGSFDFKMNTDNVDENSENFKVCKKAPNSQSETCLKSSSRKIEKTKKESSSSINRVKKSNHQPKNICPSKLSMDNIYKSKGHYENESGNKLIDGNKTKSSKTTSSSTQTSKSFEAKGIASRKLREKSEAKESRTVKDFNFKSEKKIKTSNTVPTIESLSIEKSVEIAVGIEMDNIRRLMLDQNLSLHKELLKVREMAKKQTEVTRCLFSVMNEVLETNKKLISKLK